MMQTHNASQLFALRKLNTELGDFVKYGLVDVAGRAKISLSRIEGSLAEQLLRGLEYAPPAPKGKPGDEQMADAYSLFVTFVKEHHMLENIRQAMPTLRCLSEEQQRTLCDAQGLQLAKGPNVPAADRVLTAFTRAGLNRTRALQRVGALLFLTSQSKAYGLAKEDLEAESQAALELLYERAASFMATRLKFAVVLGGEPLAQARTEVMKNSFAPRFGIMQYLEEDEHLPGRWQTSDEEAFRAKLEEYSKAQAQE